MQDQQIRNWSRALSDTENSRCVATVGAIKKVLEDYFGSKVKVFRQGSYANSTNVRQDSDVDIVVCYQNAYYSDLSLLSPIDLAMHNQNRITHEYNFAQFKNDVELLLHANFANFVDRKEKCIKISGNSYRINADVVPCFTLKKFASPYRVVAEGIQLFTDSDSAVVTNFPDHHKTNGQDKNQLTNQNYKSVVRIIKKCRNHLIENNHIDEKFMSSFLLESIIWNVPDSYFSGSTHKEVTNNVIRKIYNDMANSQVADSYREINNLNLLFRGQSQRTHDGVKQFIEHAYNVIN